MGNKEQKAKCAQNKKNGGKSQASSIGAHSGKAV